MNLNNVVVRDFAVLNDKDSNESPILDIIPYSELNINDDYIDLSFPEFVRRKGVEVDEVIFTDLEVNKCFKFL